MKSSKKISINQIETGSLLTISSFNNFTSSYTTGSFQGNLDGTSSFAQTASYVDLGYIPENVVNKNTGSLTNSTSSYPSDYTVSQSLDSKLNKDTTSGVERVWVNGTDGIGAYKPTSDFKDVLEFANLASFPVTGESGKIYLALDTNKTYRWSGSVYVHLSGGNKQILTYFHGNWTTTNLNQIYYINFDGTIVSTGGHTNPINAMTMRHWGFAQAPYNGIIKSVKIKMYSGSYTGTFYLGTATHPDLNVTFDATNRLIHSTINLSSPAYTSKKYEEILTSPVPFSKGDVICPMLIFSAQAVAAKNGFQLIIEIEEVI